MCFPLYQAEKSIIFTLPKRKTWFKSESSQYKNNIIEMYALKKIWISFYITFSKTFSLLITVFEFVRTLRNDKELVIKRDLS